MGLGALGLARRSGHEGGRASRLRGAAPSWIVERTFDWLNRSRRLSKEYERTTESTEAFIRIAMIHQMLKRLKPVESKLLDRL